MGTCWDCRSVALSSTGLTWGREAAGQTERHLVLLCPVGCSVTFSQSLALWPQLASSVR